jgi:regulator of sigma E protease
LGILAALPALDLTVIQNIGSAVVLVGVLVFIHEFGHFIVAKACGVGVPVFSIGFGRRLFGVQIGETDYRLSALPFGGYVMLAGADPFGYVEDGAEDIPPERAFLNKPVWQRLLVIGAGPAFNLALPFVVFTLVLMAGEPQQGNEVGMLTPDGVAAELGIEPGDRIVRVGQTDTPTMVRVRKAVTALPPGEHDLVVQAPEGARTLQLVVPEDGLTGLGIGSGRASAVVGVDDPASPAGKAGLRTGDRIVGIGGATVDDWLDIQQALEGATGPVNVRVEDEEGEPREARLGWEPGYAPLGFDTDGTPSANWGLLPAEIFVDAVSASVQDEGGVFTGCAPAPPPPPSPAQLAGIQDGDRFLTIDGAPVDGWGDVIDRVAGSLEGEGDAASVRSLNVELVREGQVVSLDLTPRVVETTNAFGDFVSRPMIGVYRLGRTVGGPEVREYYAFPDAVTRSVDETVWLGTMMVEQIGKLVTGEASVRKSVGGPVEMVRQASAAAERGIFEYARLMGVLSISLGIVNLLPVPVLDGGQLLFFLLEAVRGRPVSVALRERAQQIGVIFMVVLMISVLVMDLQKLFGAG